MFNRVLRGLVIVFVLVTVVSFLLLAGLSTYYLNTMPANSQPDQGRTHAFDSRGWTVYLSASEIALLDIIGWVLFVSATTAFFVGHVYMWQMKWCKMVSCRKASIENGEYFGNTSGLRSENRSQRQVGGDGDN